MTDPAPPRPAGGARPHARRARVVTLALLLLCAGFLVLASLPGDLGALRVAGPSVLWWYGGVVAPIAASLVTPLAGGGRAVPGADGATRPAAAPAALSAWLVPSMWLVVPAAVLSGAADGLWLGLLLVVGPLLALASGAPDPAASEPPSVLEVTALLVIVGAIVWANLSLAGDAAVRLGAPRWAGVGIAAVPAVALVPWRPAPRLCLPLLLLALVAVVVPLLGLAAAAARGPLEAWRVVAERPSFVFPSTSPWVTEGRDLRLAQGGRPLLFEEEHRLTATSAGILRALTVDGARVTERQWVLVPGQSVTLRAGDRLEPTAGLRVRFEPGKRVPGAPPSGAAWVATRRHGLLEQLGLAVTVLGGALGLLAPVAGAVRPRWALALAGAGMLVVLAWVQGWAIYGALGAPDAFMGGGRVGDLIELPRLILGGGSYAPGLEFALLGGTLAAFLAATIGLRARVASLDTGGDGEIGRDLGLWVGLFAVAALASLWPVDPWHVTLWSLGAAGATFAPVVLGRGWPVPPGSRAAASLVGFLAFAGLSVVASLRPAGEGGVLERLVLGHPATAALPLALGVLRVLARRSPIATPGV